RQKIDDVVADALDEAHELKPTRGQLFTGRFQLVQVQNFVLQVEVQFPRQEALQVLVDEEVAGVAGGVLTQMMLQIRDRLAFGVSAALGVEGGQCLGVVLKLSGNSAEGFAEDAVLLI